jgi:hypothetical protein
MQILFFELCIKILKHTMYFYILFFKVVNMHNKQDINNKIKSET